MGWLLDFIDTQKTMAEFRYWDRKARESCNGGAVITDESRDITEEYANSGMQYALLHLKLANAYEAKHGNVKIDFNKTVKLSNPDLEMNAYPFLTDEMNGYLNELHKYSGWYELRDVNTNSGPFADINSFKDCTDFNINFTVDNILKEKHTVKDGKAFKLAMRYALTNDMFSAEEMIAKFKPELARKIINAMEIPDDEQDEEWFINMPEKTAYFTSENNQTNVAKDDSNFNKNLINKE